MYLVCRLLLHPPPSPPLFPYTTLFRSPQHRVHSVAPLLHADMREAEKVECLGLPFSTPLPVVDRKRTKFQQPRFLGMQFQVELPHSFREFRPELFGIPFALESNHDIVSESHDDNIAVLPLLTPHLDPQEIGRAHV